MKKNCELLSELRTNFEIILFIVNKKKNNFRSSSQNETIYGVMCPLNSLNMSYIL